MTRTRKQKSLHSLKRLIITQEGLKVSATLIGLIVTLFPLVMGDAQPMAIVLVSASFIWGWRQALYILGGGTLISLFARSFTIGMILLFILPFVIFAAGLFKMIAGIFGYFMREVEYIFT